MGRTKEPTEFDILNVFVMEMEREGVSRKQVHENIHADMARQISDTIGITVSLDQIQRLADKCISNEWLEHAAIGSQYNYLVLTATGLGIVRSRQRREEQLSNRSALKITSDFLEEHKGLFLGLGFLVALAGVLIKLFMR